jgi:hypothetical protein
MIVDANATPDAGPAPPRHANTGSASSPLRRGRAAQRPPSPFPSRPSESSRSAHSRRIIFGAWFVSGTGPIHGMVSARVSTPYGETVPGRMLPVGDHEGIATGLSRVGGGAPAGMIHSACSCQGLCGCASSRRGSGSRESGAGTTPPHAVTTIDVGPPRARSGTPSKREAGGTCRPRATTVRSGLPFHPWGFRGGRRRGF